MRYDLIPQYGRGARPYGIPRRRPIGYFCEPCDLLLEESSESKPRYGRDRYEARFKRVGTLAACPECHLALKHAYKPQKPKTVKPLPFPWVRILANGEYYVPRQPFFDYLKLTGEYKLRRNGGSIEILSNGGKSRIKFLCRKADGIYYDVNKSYLKPETFTLAPSPRALRTLAKMDVAL